MEIINCLNVETTAQLWKWILLYISLIADYSNYTAAPPCFVESEHAARTEENRYFAENSNNRDFL